VSGVPAGPSFRVGPAARVRVDALLADSVVVGEDGKLDATGAGWNLLFAERVPTVHPRLGLGLLLRVAAGDGRASHELEVRLEDPAGAEIPLTLVPAGTDPGRRRLRASFAVDPPPPSVPLAEQVLAVGINVDAVPLERTGAYRFVVAVDGADAAVSDFAVVLRDP
jgi:hypothetical protein